MDSDTALGGGSARFPDTRHSAVVRMQSCEPGVRTAGFSDVIAAYWKPVYKYLRLKWKLSNEDAKDLTQAFFARAIEKEFFDQYDAALGTFRAYLRTCLDGFAANHHHAGERLKRGGGIELVSLDFTEAEKELVLAGGEESVETTFDREWVRNLFGLAVEELRSRAVQNNRAEAFQVFERYDLQGDVTYAALGAQLGVTPATVTNYLAAMRRDFRRILLEKLKALTATEREFRSEARHLFGIEV